MDARRSPQRIRRSHLVHKGANGRIGPGTAGADPLRAVRPSPTEPLAMPPEHRLRLHDHQGGAPLPPRGGEQDPKQAIRWAALRALAGTCQDGQLLTKRQVLKGDRSVSAAHQADRSEENDKRRQHALSCRVFGDRINRRGRADRVMAKHTNQSSTSRPGASFARGISPPSGRVMAAGGQPSRALMSEGW